MRNLRDDQFKDYTFRTATYSEGQHSAAVMYTPSGDPVGSIAITDRSNINQSNQWRINRTWDREHDPSVVAWSGFRAYHGQDDAPDYEDQIPGQQQWTGGNFDHNLPHVGWMGVHSEHRHPALIRGLAAAAVGERGYVPMADHTLSEDGARISRGMSRKFGMKPHPVNPTMTATLDFGSRSQAEMDRMVTEYAEMYSEGLDDHSTIEGGAVRTWSAAEAEDTASALEKEHRSRTLPPSKRSRPQKETLF